MPQNTSELLEHIVEATILAMVVDPEFREEWFSTIQVIKLQPPYNTDEQLGLLIDAIIRLLMGDRITSIKPVLSGAYEQTWHQICDTLVTSQNIKRAVSQYLSAKTLEDRKAVFDKWEEYLLDARVDQALKEMLEQAEEAGDDYAYQTLLALRTLLARCRVFGSSAAFSELEVETSRPIIRDVDLDKIIEFFTENENNVSELLAQFPELLPVARCVYRVHDESTIQLRLGRLTELMDSFSSSESDAIPSLGLWEGPLGPPLLEYLGINIETIRRLCVSDYCIEYIDSDEDIWFYIPDFVVSYLVCSQEAEEKRGRHRDIARHLRKTILKMQHEISTRQVPLELIRHIEGKPLGVLQEDIIEYMFALQFVEMASNQTENLHFAQATVSAAQRWHHHLLEAEEFRQALNVASILKHPLLRWGRLDEAKSLIFETTDRWQEREPEKTAEITVEFLRALDFDANEEYLENKTPNSEKDELVENAGHGQPVGIEDPIEQRHAGIREYESQGDLEGQAYAYYRLSKEYFHLRKFRESFEANYISEELAHLTTNKLLLANILLLRGRSIAASENHEDAVRVLYKSLQLLEATNDIRAIGECHLWLGTSFVSANKADEAIEHLNIALATAEHFFDDYEIARTLLGLGMAHDLLGDQEQAIAFLTRAKEMYDQGSNNGFSLDLESYISALSS